MSWLHSITTAAAFVTTMLCFSPTQAMACRDCPFPMKVGTNQWLLPGGYILVSIVTDSNNVRGSKIYTRVTLKDADSGEVIAQGSVYRYKTQREMQIILRDEHGRRLRGSIWEKFEEPVIRARFACLDQDCAIKMY